MNLYALKGENVWELVTGLTLQEALVLLGQVNGNQSYYYGHIDRRTNNFIKPCQKLFQEVFGFSYPEQIHIR